jgi:hypothetical protein
MAELPIGEEAAAARRRQPAAPIDEVRRTLPVDTVDTEINDLLDQVGVDPLDTTRWTRLHAELRSRFQRDFDRYPRDPVSDLYRWELAMNWAKQGSYIAGQMDEIADAEAPICTVHGPMTDSDDPAIFQSQDGHRWHCAGRPGCTATYWWIDGTCLRRATP